MQLGRINNAKSLLPNWTLYIKAYNRWMIFLQNQFESNIWLYLEIKNVFASSRSDPFSPISECIQCFITIQIKFPQLSIFRPHKHTNNPTIQPTTAPDNLYSNPFWCFIYQIWLHKKTLLRSWVWVCIWVIVTRQTIDEFTLYAQAFQQFKILLYIYRQSALKQSWWVGVFAKYFRKNCFATLAAVYDALMAWSISTNR